MNVRKLLLSILLYSVFTFYLIIFFQIVLLGRVQLWRFLDDRPMWRSVNLVPFHSVADYISRSDNIAVRNLLGNIALFVPMGVYLPLIRRDKRMKINIAMILLLSLAIEVTQYILAIGVSDIDDVILNCAGGFLGISLYKTLLFIVKDFNKTRFIITIIAPVAGLSLAFIFWVS